MEPISFFQGLGIVIKFLPQFIDLIKFLHQKIDKGMETHEIKKSFERIEKAFEPSRDTADAAGDLDDVFRGRK